MITNYFKTSWRSLVRNKSYAVINLAGLTLGLGIAIVLFWIVRFEYSFDRHHAAADRLYRVRAADKYGEVSSHVPQGAINALRNEIPGVEKSANVHGHPPNSLKAGRELFDVPYVFFIEPDFMEMIDVKWIAGSPQTSLTKPGQVVLDEPTARRFFKGDPVGQVIKMDNAMNLTVSGVISKAPANSDFQFPVILSYETKKRMDGHYQEDYWGGGDSFQHGYVMLKAGTDAKKTEAALTKKVLTRQADSEYRSFDMMPVSKSHFDAFNDPFNYYMPEWMLYTLASIGLFLIVIACINFINLATAQATQRSREIGVRKVLGSSRSQLILQFLGETALLVFVAIAFGGTLGTWLISRADQLLNTRVSHSEVWDISTVLFLVILGFAVTLFAGLYPGLVLSGVRPAQAFKSKISSVSPWGISLRQGLVVTQFVVAQGLVICTLFGIQQVRYMTEKDLGFNQSAVVTVSIPDRRGETAMRNRLRDHLLGHHEIKEVSFGLTSPASDRNHWWSSVNHPALPGGEQIFRLQHVDENYFGFYRIPVVAGRNLRAADSSSSSAIINEKAMRDLGYRDPDQVLGQQIKFWSKDWNVVGVVKDYHSEDLKNKVIPHVFAYHQGNFQLMNVRIDTHKSKEALNVISKEWKAEFPNHYFKYRFLGDTIRSAYTSELKLANFLKLFAIVGIFIGCLGLFGLVSFVVIQRMKEIGIRKLLGATVTNILTLLSADFLKLVLIAFIIAAPLGYWAMKKFLENYEYKIDIEWWVFAVSGGFAVLIAFATLSFHALRAAAMNPVKSLKSE